MDSQMLHDLISFMSDVGNAGDPAETITALKTYLSRSWTGRGHYAWYKPSGTGNYLSPSDVFCSLEPKGARLLPPVRLQSGNSWYRAAVLGELVVLREARDVRAAVLDAGAEPLLPAAPEALAPGAIFVPVRQGSTQFGLLLICVATEPGDDEVAFWRLVGIILAQAVSVCHKSRAVLLLEGALDSAQVPFVLFDADGVVVRASRGARELIARRTVPGINGVRWPRVTLGMRFSPPLMPDLARHGGWSGEVRVPRDDGTHETIPAVVRSIVDAGGTPVGAIAVGQAHPRGNSEGQRPYLTAREERIAQLVADGLSSKEIAVRLGITERTVQFHRHKLRVKLGIGKRPIELRRAVLEVLENARN